jgi:hypothetical protein
VNKTPAEVLKENFWIGAKGGLLDAKHILRMGQSVWLYLYLLRNQTSLNQAGEGVINYGHPLTFDHIGEDLKGIPASTIAKWANRLRKEKYIRTEPHGHEGLTFWISKGKNKTRKVKVTHEEAVTMSAGLSTKERYKCTLPPRPILDAEEISPRPKMDAESPSPRPELDVKATGDIAQAISFLARAKNPWRPTPKGFTPESPSYYNKDAVLENAPRTSVLSEEKIRERQNLLTEQKEAILQKYSATGPIAGKVTAFRKEATA